MQLAVLELRAWEISTPRVLLDATFGLSTAFSPSNSQSRKPAVNPLGSLRSSVALKEAAEATAKATRSRIIRNIDLFKAVIGPRLLTKF
jgi:hypothetical protein